MEGKAQERLLQALAEQLKLPLLQIARQAELGRSDDITANLEHIGYIADTALRLVDGFLLSADLHDEQTLRLEPVSLSSALTDVAHRLEPLAKQNDCDIAVSLGGKYAPAMAHRESLDSALMLLGYSLIEGRSGNGKRHEIMLGAHRSSNGLVAGIFDNQPGLSTDIFRRGRALHGNARQSMPSTMAANGAGVFVADSLLRAMAAPLHVARHHNLTGLAATFHQSGQLQLI